ncbi:hypothetical protein EMCRGX_G002896 [Ephydatia muelleri]
MTPLQYSQQLKLPFCKFQLLGILQRLCEQNEADPRDLLHSNLLSLLPSLSVSLPFPSLTISLDPLQSSVLDHADVILRAPSFHPYGSQQCPSKAAPKLVYSGAPTAAGSSRRVLSAAGWHQILGPKRDKAAQQNEAPVAGSVEGQSVSVKIETLVGKVVQCNHTGGNSPGKSRIYLLQKASVRDSYKADPEKKKASVRDRQKYEDNSAAIKASERNRYWYDPAVRLAKRAAERKRYRRGHRTTTTTQSYSLYEPKSHALMEYNGGLEKAILRDSELLSEVNDAFYGGGNYTEEFATHRIDTGVPEHDNQPVFLRKHLASLRVLASPVHQRVLSKKLEDHQFSLLLKASSPADKAWLLSVSASHAASWLLVTPPSLDLNFEPNELYQWWLGMDTARGSSCSLCPGATTCKQGGDVVQCPAIESHICNNE